MAKTSAGILLYKRKNNELQVFLVHPGGPFFTNKDEGVWSVPKGELEEGEDPLAAARREFEEETGCRPEGKFFPLSPVKQKGGKIVLAWAMEGGIGMFPEEKWPRRCLKTKRKSMIYKHKRIT